LVYSFGLVARSYLMRRKNTKGLQALAGMDQVEQSGNLRLT
jgi:hypothetical protein